MRRFATSLVTAHRERVAIIGAGPAGLTAAYLLTRAGHPVTVLEADPTHVGGLSRTVSYKGFRFDIGGHRFFTKSSEVEKLWREILPNDLLDRPRTSSIYYRNQFFQYPLRPGEALRKLGPLEAVRCMASYARARVAPVANPRNFEEWVINQFGRRLFEIFFKTYTEKVWGMDCRDISADWAAQRIRNLSLGAAVLDALRPNTLRENGAAVIKTLTQRFLYPRHGPGMMWDACARQVLSRGGVVRRGRTVTECALQSSGLWQVTHIDASGHEETVDADHVISSAPLPTLINGLRPHVDAQAVDAASQLRYRDFLMVALVLNEQRALGDQWIYVHDESVRVGRIQNFKAWSPEMVPDARFGCYGMEYFCFERDDLWQQSDDALIAMASRELVQLGLAAAEHIVDGCVVRQRQAYPVYDDRYAAHLTRIRGELSRRFPTLHLVGRNGMHRYNNQDHAMMTAMLTVENIRLGHQAFDVWRVNGDAEYLETETSSGATMDSRLVPRAIASTQDASL